MMEPAYAALGKEVLQANGEHFADAASEAAAQMIATALERCRMIDLLRADEMSSVEICSDNPDFNGQPNCLVYTRHVGQYFKDGEGNPFPVPDEFRADTINECLVAACNGLQQRIDNESQGA